MVIDDGSLCGGFGTGGYVMVVLLCIGDQLLLMLFCAIEAHGINGDAGLGSYHMVSDAWRSSGGFGYQLVEKPGWDLLPTFLGGLVPLRGSSSSDELGALVLVTSDSLVSDDVMANGHLFSQVVQWLKSRSGSTCYTRRQQKKTLFLHRRGGRLQAVCSSRRWRGRPGGVYKDRIVIFFSFMGVLVRFGL
jgi:hypothetical protein